LSRDQSSAVCHSLTAQVDDSRDRLNLVSQCVVSSLAGPPRWTSDRSYTSHESEDLREDQN